MHRTCRGRFSQRNQFYGVVEIVFGEVGWSLEHGVRRRPKQRTQVAADVVVDVAR